MFFSCTNGVDNRNKSSSIEKDIKKNDTSLRKCILEKDTMIDHKNLIKYVIVDSFYTLKIQVGGLDTLLPYQFDCSVPRGLVPSFYSFFKNTVCLIKGTGQHYREFIICYVENNRIIIKHYETALATDLQNDIVVYQNPDTTKKIYVANIKGVSKKIFNLPAVYAGLPITKTTITKNTLSLIFSNDKKVIFSY
jgi:hypothetical protein